MMIASMSKKQVVRSLEADVVKAHDKLGEYSKKIVDTDYLRNFWRKQSEDLYQAAVKENSRLAEYTIQELVKSSDVQPQMYSAYRIFSEASCRSIKLQDMYREMLRVYNTALSDWTAAVKDSREEYHSQDINFQVARGARELWNEYL